MKITEYESRGRKLYKWAGYVGTDALGQFKTTKSGFLSKREAELDANRFVTEFNAGMHHRKDPNAITTLNDLYNHWLPTYRGTVAESTLYKTIRTLENNILTPYGDMDLDDFTPAKVQTIVNDLHQKMVTYKRPLMYLSQMFKLGAVQGLIAENPFDRVIQPKARKTASKNKVLDSEQFATFSHYVDETFGTNNPRAFTFMRLLAFTGMRRGEALALAWNDVDFRIGAIHIHKSLTLGMDNQPYIAQSAKTEAGNRKIPLDNETFATISNLRDVVQPQSDDDLIFATQKGVLPSLNTPQKWMNKIIQTANGKLPHLTPHMLRHTYITLTLASGNATPKQVQYIVGQADISVTMNVYNHITKEQVQDVRDVFADAVGGLINRPNELQAR